MKKSLRIVLPILLGCAILWWMYREFDFGRVSYTLFNSMSWGWMLFSLVFGLSAEVFRGLRWVQTLEPLGQHARRSTCIHAVFISYMASLVIPRIGEVTRCEVLRRYDGVSFTKALGTVVTERIVDTLLMLLLTLIIFLTQLPVFLDFFRSTGFRFSALVYTFTPMGWTVTLFLLVITLLFLWYLMRRMGIGSTVSRILGEIKMGMFSLRDVRNLPLFTAYTLGIWLSYFLHFYITFYAFSFTADLGLIVGLVAFIACTLAVVVPTPNGMGSFHFAVKTVLVLYGVAASDAETYVLLVHALQTLLLPLLGIYSLAALSLRSHTKH